jgi:hypothetical protein
MIPMLDVGMRASVTSILAGEVCAEEGEIVKNCGFGRRGLGAESQVPAKSKAAGRTARPTQSFPNNLEIEKAPADRPARRGEKNYC